MKAKTSRGTFGSSRSYAKEHMRVPGPGQYSLDDQMKKNTHSFGFGTSKRPELGAQKGKLNVPGPG